MKMEILSLCAMMFLFYGTECQAVGSGETEVSQQKYRVFPKSKKKANRAKKRKTIIEKQEESTQDPYATKENNPWFRDNRSFADVVKGVKRDEIDDGETFVGNNGYQQEEVTNDEIFVGNAGYQQEIEESVPQTSKRPKKRSKVKGNAQPKIDNSKKKYNERRDREKRIGKSAWKN